MLLLVATVVKNRKVSKVTFWGEVEVGVSGCRLQINTDIQAFSRPQEEME